MFWLTLGLIGGLVSKDVRIINEHLQNIYEELEEKLKTSNTVKWSLIFTTFSIRFSGLHTNKIKNNAIVIPRHYF